MVCYQSSRNLVLKAGRFEATFGQIAYAHLFVTRALEEYLVKEWRLEGKKAVLHDRPPPHFRRTDPMSQHELFSRLTPMLQPPLPSAFQAEDNSSTVLTSPTSTGMPAVRPGRPALLVSSTSWTADEDFSLLLTALDAYQAAVQGGANLPRLLVIITGKGALRSSFEKAVTRREESTYKDVAVRCAFVEARDYPTLLGCADLGVSLHTSSSGMDLPMKVVDMFGCGVPVLAKGFPCIGELVKEGKNGMVFETGEELGRQMVVSLYCRGHAARADTPT
jgi:beta-1,4-mannosyltransferase